MGKIFLAMSGGVDSTFCAYILTKEQRLDVEGIYLRLHESRCNSNEENIRKIDEVSKILGIKYHILDLKQEFKKEVLRPFTKTYEDGRTPNPCVLCNRKIKFGALLNFVKQNGGVKLATGHYARIKDGFISEAADKKKDQSYFLSNIRKEVIDFLLFPLGDMHKVDVKQRASAIDFLKKFSTQAESNEICFSDGDYIDFLKNYTNTDTKGSVLDSSGKIVGEHKGYMHYTIGKRKGFTVWGSSVPHYVLDVDVSKNTITVGSKESLKKDSFFVDNINMFIEKENFNALVKTRYKSPKTPCSVNIHPNGKAEVLLHKGVDAIASGQLAAFYDEQKIIGSGFII